MGDAVMYGHGFFLYINICKNIYIYVHRIHATRKKLIIKGEGTTGVVA
jgi:hypothetical protein